MGGRSYVIVGNGAAGVRAAETLRRLDGTASITVIAGEQEPPYSRCLLPALLAGEKGKQDLYIRPGDFYQKNRISPILGMRAVGVDTRGRQVLLENGDRVPYDSLLVATGSHPAFPPVPGLMRSGLLALRDLADARRILKEISPGKRVVVLGAGLVGLETAVALTRRHLQVSVVEKEHRIMPQQLDEPASDLVRRDLEAEGVKLVLGSGVQEAVASPGGWELRLESGERLQAELVLAATGVRPNVALLQGTGVQINRGIPVDDTMQTSVPGIYAAGDVAETIDSITGQQGLTPTWPQASLQGVVAAWNMAGYTRRYPGEIARQNVVQFRRTPVISLGITDPPEGEGYEVFTLHRPEAGLYRKLVLWDGVLKGALLVGDPGRAGVLAALMRLKVPASRYVEPILRGDFHYGYLQGAAVSSPPPARAKG